ncbi:MAG: two-component system, OmpR family, sensor kinase [Microbacteriaceae bacterium]|nr:two-component system, OmpR family, sensor kinase [Microbacteriaceae bacterium]
MRWIRRLSIRWRITLGSLLVAAVLLSGALVLFRAQVENILASTTTTVLTHDAFPYVTGVLDSPTPTIDTPARGQLVAVVDPTGAVKESNLPRGLRSRVAIIAAKSDGVHTVLDGDDSYRVLVQTIVTDAGDWTVITARNEDSAVLSLQRITSALIFGAIVLVIGVGVASWLLTSAALRPVARMRRQAMALVAEGSTEPLPIGPAKDELFALGTTLNEFITEVRQSVERERQLVSDASHELRTPLALLKTQLELSHLASGDAKALEAEITAAERSVERLSGLATGLLELSQLQAHAPETLSSWPELARELAASVDRARLLAVAKNVTIDFDVSEEPTDAAYRISPSNFGRVIANLTINAITAVPDGGTVRIALRYSSSELLLAVVDSGNGMPEDFLPVAFDRFTRSDGSRASNNVGSGLGLAIVHAIVTAAHGTISLSNGAGFTVTVSLPTAG